MEIRDSYLAQFRATAQGIFAKHPNVRSIVLAVSQYWADEANDAVHDFIVASEREMPLWPHVCNGRWYDDDNPVVDVPGELCTRCADQLLGDRGYLEWWYDNGDAISAFEAFCHESGSQDQTDAINSLPAAIARRRGDEIDVALLGPVQRPHSILHGESDAPADLMWFDPRALELYEQVCAAPAEDGPRRVLADYLLEREMPRGELLAHALAGSPTYAELLATDKLRWLAPLDGVVPVDTARFDRGFVSDIEMFAVDREHRGHPGLASVERLYIHHGSASLLDPSMRALRELGPINPAWLEDLVAAPRPWAIETLDVDFSDDGMIAILRAATTLPALRHLIVRGDFTEQAARTLASAAWWRQLDRVTIVDDQPLAWRDLKVPWVAVRIPCIDPVNADGWELAFGPNNACEVTQRGFSPEATREALQKLLATIPVRSVKLVASRYYAPSADDAAFLSRDGQVVT